jgi:hypothetical protein
MMLLKPSRFICVVAVMSFLLSQAEGADPAYRAPFTISQETTVVTEPLFPSGMPDYAKAFDAVGRRGVTAQNNLFVGYLKLVGTGPTIMPTAFREIFLKRSDAPLIADPPGRWVSYSSFLKDRHWSDEKAKDAVDKSEQLCLRLWEEKDDPLFAEYLKAREENLDEAVRMSMRQRYWIPWVGEIPWYFGSESLPGLAPFRQIVCGLNARGLLRFRRGDVNGAIADVLAAYRISCTMQQASNLITRLIGIASEVFSVRAISAIAASGRLSAADCATLQSGMEAVASPSPIRECLRDGERYATLSFIGALALGGGQNEYAVLQIDHVEWDRVFKIANRALDEIAEIMARPTAKGVADGYAVWLEKVDKWKKERTAVDAPSLTEGEKENDVDYTDRVTRDILQRMLPRVGRSEELDRQVRMEAAMAKTLLILATQRAREGTWPADGVHMDASVSMPADVYADGQTVRYELTVEGPVLIAVASPGGTQRQVLGASTSSLGHE